MSSRALRKILRQQEQQRLQEMLAREDDGNGSEEEPVPTSAGNLFATLNQATEEEQDDDNEAGEAVIASVDGAAPKPNTKKKKKKKKAKAKAENVAKEPSLAEEDLALFQSPNLDNSQIVEPTSFEELCQLLSVTQRNLHVLNEMSNLFERDVLEAEQREFRAQATRNRRGGRGRATNRLAAIARRRDLFIQGKEEWPALPFGGLAMEIVERRPNGVVEYRFVHSTAYQDVQRQFEICVASMDLQRMQVLGQHNPYHIATLLQLSEIAKIQHRYPDAVDHLERALFSLGRSVHSTFAEKLSQGKARLDFRRPENREFWLAAWRYIENLSLRSTWRTAYEWAKMVFSLDPEKDPYCMRLVLDQFAIRARQAQHFIDLILNSDFTNAAFNSFGMLDSEPMFAYPFANIVATAPLAYLQLGKQVEARIRLTEAIADYPWLFARLFGELQINPIPPSIWGKQPPNQHEDLASKLYVSRAKDIWNKPESMALLLDVARSVELGHTQPNLEPPIPMFEQQAPVRHVILLDKHEFTSLLPNIPTSEQLKQSDPFSPLDNLPSYNAEPPPSRFSLDELQRVHEELWQRGLQLMEDQRREHEVLEDAAVQLGTDSDLGSNIEVDMNQHDEGD